MPAIPSALIQRLRDTLARCPALESDRDLHAVFVHERLAPWIGLTPQNTPNQNARVNLLIATLCDQTNTHSENALLLFLSVLTEQTPLDDALRDNLTQLVDEFTAYPLADLATLKPLTPVSGITITGNSNIVGDGNIVTINEAALAAVTSLHQLPSPPADFTGRAEDLDTLATAIETGSVSIAGLPGMGGVGKTALALQLAARIAPCYPDAQLYLDLRGTDQEPLALAQVMAHVIRAWEPTARLPETETELAPLYRSILHGQRALLLLDNAADRAQVEPLLPPPGVALLVTSRQHFTLPGMVTRHLDALPPSDARALLLKIEPRIDGHAPAIADLCGGLPLALRLAGSALAERLDLSPADYLARLRDAHTRLGLVDASLSLSYNLLTLDLQRWWYMLSVFPATFDRAAAAAVWELDQDAASDALGYLVCYSLVHWDAALSRYSLHDLVRLFAADRLAACLDEAGYQAVHSRHAAHYLAVLRAADDLYLQGGEDNLRGLALFDLERANIEVGQHWTAAHWQQDIAIARLAADFPNAGVDCLSLRLHAQEWIAWLETALAIAREIGNRRGEGAHLGNLGLAYFSLGQRERAIEHHEQALAIAREISDRRGEGNRLGNLGVAYAALGQVERAIEHYEQALSISREIGDRRGEGADLGNLGITYAALGQVARAIEHHEQALAIAREIGDRRGEGNRLGNLGLAYFSLGQVERAIEHYAQALAIAREIGDHEKEGTWLGNLGVAYRNLGQVERAIEHYTQALAIAREIGNRWNERAWLGNLGVAYTALGQVERAIEHYEQALSISREIGDRRDEGNRLGNLGNAYYSLGQVERAIEYHEQALAIAREIGDRQNEGVWLGNLGNAYRNLGQTDKARAYLQQALAIFEDIKFPAANIFREWLAALPPS